MLYTGLCCLFFLLVHPQTPIDDPRQNPYLGAATPGDYTEMKANILHEQARLQCEFAAAGTDGKAEIRNQARTYVFKELEDNLIPSWYGTEWDFNGISETPREGQIACGYFVSTLLRDAGFKLERYRLAQQAALYIVRSLAPAEDRLDWSGLSTVELAEKMKAQRSGFYVVGLDNHVGFLLLDAQKELWFLHSSYGDPAVVVREKAVESPVLSWSNRFVMGFLETDWLVEKWLRGEKITTQKPG